MLQADGFLNLSAETFLRSSSFRISRLCQMQLVLHLSAQNFICYFITQLSQHCVCLFEKNMKVYFTYTRK